MADQTGLRGKLLRGSASYCPAGASSPSQLRGKLLRGWRQLAIAIYGDDTPRSRRKLYTEWRRYPIFQLGDNTELLALEDRLLSFLEARSAAAEVAAELASEPKVAPPSAKTALAARKAAPPKVRRRRARSPASDAAA